MTDNTTHILLFDGVCNLCNPIVQFIIKRDTESKFNFAALQSDSGQFLLKKYSLPTNDFSSIVYINADRYYLKSSAGIRVLIALGGVWKLSGILFIFPRPLRDLLYMIIAKYRYKIFGKRNTCMIPTPDIKQRFIE
jgi:predicted DCC family thiol-disulfide oxidoreductase YuxK